jgi:hypothetical protein
MVSLFGGKSNTESIVSKVAEDVEVKETSFVRKEFVKPSLKLCVPDSVTTSDTNLASLKTSPAKDGSVMIGAIPARVLQIFWLEQIKTQHPSPPSTAPRAAKKVNKFLFDLLIPGEEDEDNVRSYLMMDIFFVPDESQYVAKALGSYSSIPKVLSTNFQYQGSLLADRDCRGYSKRFPLYSIDADSNFEKKANPLYFWFELPDLMTN